MKRPKYKIGDVVIVNRKNPVQCLITGAKFDGVWEYYNDQKLGVVLESEIQRKLNWL